MSKIWIAIILLCFFLLVPSVLAGTNDVTIDIDSTNFDIGDSIVFEVWVDGSETFDSWYTNLDFNSHVSFVKCEIDDFWLGPFAKTNDSFADNGTLEGTSLNGIQAFQIGVTTPVLLFTVEFTASSNGYCDFILDDFQIFCEGPEVPTSVQSVRVKIGSGGSSGGGGTEPEDDEPIAVILTTPIKFKYYIDEKITFDASGSSDDFGIVSYLWEIEDKEITNETFEYQFKNVGNYTVTLTVEDTYGQKDTISEVITVVAEPEQEEPDNTDNEEPEGNETDDEQEEQDGDIASDRFNIKPQIIVIFASVAILGIFIILRLIGKI